MLITCHIKSSHSTRAIIRTPQADLWNSWRKDDIRREVAKRAAMDHLRLLLETSRLEPKWLKVDALAALMNALVSRKRTPYQPRLHSSSSAQPVNKPQSTPSKGLRYQALTRRTVDGSSHLGRI